MTASTSAESQNLIPMYRQGDVLLVGNATIPDDATVVPRDRERGAILQEGRVTGHAHRIAGPCAAVLTKGDARYLRVLEAADLVHDEHTVITLPAGDYQIIIHHEYQPGALARQVQD